MSFNTTGLKPVKFIVDNTWMLAIGTFRDTLNDYTNNPIIQKIIDKVNNADYIIAPIADNKMFRIIVIVFIICIVQIR